MGREPRLRDVADRAGVSVSLVSSYLNTPHLVSDASSERIQQAIDALGFVRNDAARQLREGSSRMVAFIAFDISDPLFVSVARGARRRAAENGLSLVLADTDGEAETEEQYLRLFQEQRVRGVLLSPSGDPWRYLRELEARRVPAVLIDQASPSTRWSAVTVNDVLGGELAVGHLLDIGRTRIATVGGPQQISQVADRIAGARNVMKRSSAAPLEVIDTTERTISAGIDVGAELAARPSSERPDGVFCINDLLASGLIHGLQNGGLRVPEDVAVVGYNDTATDALSPVPLTSVRQPHEMFGSVAVDLLLEELAADESTPRRQVVFDPDLVVRQSTTG
jgi:LacI family transcriptional regulator